MAEKKMEEKIEEKERQDPKVAGVKISDGICPECKKGKLENGEECLNCDGRGLV